MALAPSLSLTVHCGGDYEDIRCVATVTVAAGVVTVDEPECATVAGISEDLVRRRLIVAMGGAPDGDSSLDSDSTGGTA